MDRQLINYLPYQVREFQEYKGITTGEQPEFELAWNCYQDAFDNQFIDTAGDYGLSRWEKMLHITPKATDTLETRRIRIKTRLNNFTPYTFRVFMRMMKHLADGEPFEVYLDPGSYLMRFMLQWGMNGKIESLEWLIEEILPENIAIDAKNEIPCVSEGVALVSGGVCFVKAFFITNDGTDHHTISGAGLTGGAAVGVEKFLITNDSVEAFTMEGTAETTGGIVNSVFVTLTNDFNERFKIAGVDGTGGGTVTTEIIKIYSEERTDP